MIIILFNIRLRSIDSSGFIVIKSSRKINFDIPCAISDIQSNFVPPPDLIRMWVPWRKL